MFSERILVHVPSRRPKISEILTSQWINNQHITLESALVSSGKPTPANINKKIHWFSRKRIIHKNIDASQADANLVQLYFNTKRANSVLEENFLHPINVISTVSGDDTANDAQTKTRRKSLFGHSLKKKIGPMEEKNKSNLFNNCSNGIEDKISITHSDQIQALRKTVESSSKHNSIISQDDGNDDEEQGDFVMAPTNTDCLDGLHPLEIETRAILQKVGITTEMLCHAIDSGPRSDIIGAYRIVIHRLQRRKFLSKQPELPTPTEPMPMIRQKSDKMCAIL